MTVRPLGEEYQTTIVCVDSYDGCRFRGRLYHPYPVQEKTFESMTQFLLEMEENLNTMPEPPPDTAIRTFPRQSCWSAAPPGPGADICSGNRTTFALRILFRQNASWQGSVVWLEGKQEQSFRSVLELILLMDSALSVQQAG